jgi:hypothetical protein
MMSRFFQIVFFLFFFSSVISQTGRISGKVIDAKTGETLPGATIMLDGTTKGTSADFDGNYSLNNVPAGNVTLVISYISYDTKKITGVKVPANDAVNVDVQLNQSSSQELGDGRSCGGS